MTNRDEDLDQLERDLKAPYIESPDRLAIGDGSMCWLDAHRKCGPDCIAFNVTGVCVDDDVPVQGHLQCVLLAATTAQNAGLIQLVAANRRVITELQDKRREEQLAQTAPSPFAPRKA